MQSVESGHYVWAVPGRPERVRINAAALEFIDNHVRTAYRAVPRRGAETGGLLLGSITHQFGRSEISIEAAEVIECEHRNGPSFSLSATDREKFSQQKNRLETEGRVIVGYFRSKTGSESNEPDRELAGTAGLFLLLLPESVARVTANLMRLEDGKVVEQTGYALFPFASTEAPAHAPPLAPPAIPEVAPAQQKRRSSNRRTMLIWIWLAAFSIGCVVAGYKVTHRPPLEVIELDAEQTAERLILHWNGKAALLLGAQAGQLTIEDGERVTHLSLNRGDLQLGKYSYSPSTGTVKFLLAAREARGILTAIDPSR